MKDDSSPDDVDRGRAYMLLRAMYLHDVDTEVLAVDEVAALIARMDDQDQLAQGLCAVVDELVGFIDEADRVAVDLNLEEAVGEPMSETLRVYLPAVLVRLTATAGIEHLVVPTVAATFTAAALGFDCYAWRASLGDWTESEYVAFAFATWYLCDLMDQRSGQPRFAIDMIG